MHANVNAVLQNSKVNFTLHRHRDYPGPIQTPVDFARALGYPTERITKALYLQMDQGETFLLALCSVNKKVDLARIARFSGCKRLSFAKPHILMEKTGYPPKGVSPLGLGSANVIMDEGLFSFPTILVGAGQAGIEIEIEPIDLKNLLEAETLSMGVS